MKEKICVPFRWGKVVITANANEVLSAADTDRALLRHTTCDWGDVSDKDWARNNEAMLQNNAQVLSVYTDSNGIKFWIITEHDRSATTILLPSDS